MSVKTLVVITGGIAAYKSIDVISGLKKRGLHVSTMATDEALNFVSESVLKITSDKYWEHSWDAPVHINATDDIRLFIVVPATVNIIAKIAHGIADDLVSSSIVALPDYCKKIVCPACNTRMWENPVVQRNIATIKEDGWIVMPPDSGMLACGTEGVGKLPSTKAIIDFAVKEYY